MWKIGEGKGVCVCVKEMSAKDEGENLDGGCNESELNFTERNENDGEG